MGFVYKITNKVNNKIYVGKTSKTIEVRFQQHLKEGQRLSKRDKSLLHKAIKKYGAENFKVECLESNINNIKDLNLKEKKWIEQLHSRDPSIGYNIALGGDGGDQGELIRKKIKESLKGRNVWIKGRITINNGEREKKILLEDLDSFLNQGWTKGRLPRSFQSIENWKKSWDKKSVTEKEEIKNKRLLKREQTIQKRTKKEKEQIAKKISTGRKNNPNCKSPRKGIPAKEWMTEEHLIKFKNATKKPKSIEHRKHLSEIRIKKGLSKGKNNGMYGKGYKIAGYNSKTAKQVMCVETGQIYYSTIIASQETGIRAGGIQDAARGVQKTCAGYHWKYIENDNN